MDKIIIGNCESEIMNLQPKSVDCIATSPPYFNQRVYSQNHEQIYGGDPNCVHEWMEFIPRCRKPTPGDKPGPNSDINSKRGVDENRPAKISYGCKCGAWKGDLGQELEPGDYIEHMCNIFEKTKRVLKDTGILFVNLGEKYNYSGGAGNQESKWRRDHHTQFGKIVDGSSQSLPYINKNLPKQSALCIPWLFVTKMVYEYNWILKDTLIWKKIVPMPFSGDRKFTIDYEPIFMFAKTSNYYFKQSLVEKKHLNTIGNRFGGTKHEGYENEIYSGKIYNATKSRMKNRRTTLEKFDDVSIVDSQYLEYLESIVFGDNDKIPNLISCNTSKTKEKHYATFPPELVEILIDAGCPSRGTVLDPFGGIGNTAIAACKKNCEFILIELEEKFATIAANRVFKAKRDRDAINNSESLLTLK